MQPEFSLVNYLPVIMFIGVGILIGILPMAIGKLVSRHKPNPEKNSAYECGFATFEEARMQFDVRYYLIGILFIIFDIETIFLFPWGVSLNEIGWSGYFIMIIFLIEFLLGFIYAWRKGALDWE